MRALDRTEDRSRARARLRLARSMRKGVSLAVWIGGSVAELEAVWKALISGGSDRESFGTARGAGWDEPNTPAVASRDRCDRCDRRTELQLRVDNDARMAVPALLGPTSWSRPSSLR